MAGQADEAPAKRCGRALRDRLPLPEVSRATLPPDGPAIWAPLATPPPTEDQPVKGNDLAEINDFILGCGRGATIEGHKCTQQGTMTVTEPSLVPEHGVRFTGIIRTSAKKPTCNFLALNISV